MMESSSSSQSSSPSQPHRSQLYSNCSPSSSSQQRSLIHQNFSVKDKKRVCENCHISYSLNTSPTVLYKHLRKCNPNALSRTDPKMFDVVMFIVTSNLPINIIENEYFKKITYNLLNSRNTFLTKLNELNYTNERIIYRYLERVKQVSATIDGWTSPNGDHYVGITTSFIQGNNINTVLINVEKIQKSNSKNISSFINDTLIDYGVLEKLVGITTDAGSEIIAATRVNHMNRFPCVNHMINLALNDFFNSTALIQNLLGKCQNISTHFKNSFRSQWLLHEVEDSELFPEFHVSKKIKKYTPTRWYSSMQMFRSILGNLKGIFICLSNRGMNNEISINGEYIMISSYILFYCLYPNMFHTFNFICDER